MSYVLLKTNKSNKNVNKRFPVSENTLFVIGNYLVVVFLHNMALNKKLINRKTTIIYKSSNKNIYFIFEGKRRVIGNILSCVIILLYISPPSFAKRHGKKSQMINDFSKRVAKKIENY